MIKNTKLSNTACLITVRTTSTRLPGKALLSLRGKRVIEHVIDRAKLVKKTERIILCTSDKKEDDILERIAKENGIDWFRGSLEDKVGRWYGAVQKFGVEFFYNVDGDDLFFDPQLVDTALQQMADNPSYEVIVGHKELPCGAFTHAIRSSVLKKVCETKNTNDTEMYSVFFEDPKRWKIEELNVKDRSLLYPNIRMTLDYQEDFDFFDRVLDEFNTDKNTISMKRIIERIKKKPEIAQINFFREIDWRNNQKKMVQSMDTKMGAPKKTTSANSWRFQGNEQKYAKEVLDLGFGISTAGSMNQRLEEAFAKRFGVPYAVTSTSGTSTLHQALAAFGVGPGNEVIIPALTVIMCGYAVIYTGAKPVFADVDKKTFLIDPKDVEKKITKKTKAIMVVHLYGQVCNMTAIMKIAKKYNLFVLEDCAQCYLGTDNKGRIGGTIGHAGSFSFETTKHLSTGDGGILITNDEKIAERMRKFGSMGFKQLKAQSGHARKNKNTFQDPLYLRHDTFGLNYRMPELIAAVGLAQVEKIDMLVKQRQRIASRYLTAMRNCDWLIPQSVPAGYVNSYYTFALLYKGQEKKGVSWYDFRKKFMEFGGDGIYSAWALVYNEPIMQTLNKQGKFFTDLKAQAPAYKGFLNKVSCPVAESLQPKLMQFPLNQGDDAEIDKQVDALRKTIKYFD